MIVILWKELKITCDTPEEAIETLKSIRKIEEEKRAKTFNPQKLQMPHPHRV